MPWKAISPVEQRVQFVREWQQSETSMTALCHAYGISRETGYKWVRRFLEDGEGEDVSVLEERSRRPLSSPRQVGGGVVDILVHARKLHPHWGPRKLRAWLEERLEGRDVVLPAPSTIGEVLRREGLVQPRRRRRHTPPYTKPFAHATAPNSVWCVDFKGHFRVGDGTVVYPLTITDAYSRFLLRCDGVLRPDEKEARPIFQGAFREFGLPSVIRSDNGPPFASTGAGGLTELSVWWIRLGIVPERIEPGKPQQNGRHERMHRTLKQAVASPPAASFYAQQRAFGRFRREYNQERPHEALGQRTPATFYAPSSRPYPAELPSLEHPWEEQRIVDRSGDIRIGRRTFHIAPCLHREPVTLVPAGDRQWEVRFGPIVLGIIDETRAKKGLIRPKNPRRSGAEVSAISPVCVHDLSGCTCGGAMGVRSTHIAFTSKCQRCPRTNKPG